MTANILALPFMRSWYGSKLNIFFMKISPLFLLIKVMCAVGLALAFILQVCKGKNDESEIAC
jgi:hypothetical protein